MKNKFRKFERHFKMEKNGVFHFVISFVALGPVYTGPDKFLHRQICSLATCLHGSVQILLQISVVFTRLCANF